MNFIFKIVAMLAVLAAGGCRRTAAPAATPSRDGGDAQRLVALLDYVGGDYALAVRDGAVVSVPEYDEQLAFTADARRLAAGLLGPAAPPDDPLLVALAEVDARVRALAPAEAVAEACRAARD